MVFSLKMAWAYFKKIWHRGVWGIMVAISVAGIMLGTASLVVTLAVMNGFHTEITRNILSLNPHITIIDLFKSGAAAEAEISQVLDNEKRVKSYASFIYGKGLLHCRNRSQGVVVKGIAPENNQLTLVRGNWEDLDDDTLVAGRELASILHLETGDVLYLIIPSIHNIGAPIIPRVKKFRLAGEFDSGIYEYDTGLVIINLDTAREIFGDNSSASGIELYLYNPFHAEDLAGELRKRFEKRYLNIQTWKDRNYNLFAALKLEKTMMFLILIMIVIVATFNVAGTLIMVSVTRSRDCGIMRAVGVTRKQIGWLFRFEGLFIGLSGTLLGLAAGTFLAELLKKYHFIKLPPKVYLLSTLPVRLDAADMLLVAVTAMAVCFLATLYPSYRAGHTEVARELRYE